ncbi:hypothetical protein NMY22_g14278 [Coprinellus aureogranulatus]|nr:hypothetical protein NMY22_g14278 [Coprinellus aureogranulatus]
MTNTEPQTTSKPLSGRPRRLVKQKRPQSAGSGWVRSAGKNVAVAVRSIFRVITRKERTGEKMECADGEDEQEEGGWTMLPCQKDDEVQSAEPLDRGALDDESADHQFERLENQTTTEQGLPSVHDLASALDLPSLVHLPSERDLPSDQDLVSGQTLTAARETLDQGLEDLGGEPFEPEQIWESGTRAEAPRGDQGQEDGWTEPRGRLHEDQRLDGDLGQIIIKTFAWLGRNMLDLLRMSIEREMGRRGHRNEGSLDGEEPEVDEEHQRADQGSERLGEQLAEEGDGKQFKGGKNPDRRESSDHTIRKRPASHPGRRTPESNRQDPHNPSAQAAIVGLRNLVLESFDQRILRWQLTCLKEDASRAQLWLDAFQMVLDCDYSSNPYDRRRCLDALLRVSKECQRYPTCLRLGDQIHLNLENPPTAGGSFGDVYQGHVAGEDVAVKVFRVYLRTMEDREKFDRFMKTVWKETIIWCQLYHANVLPCYGVYHRPSAANQIGLVSPWMENGTIVQFLEKNPHANRLLLLSDIASGMAYLHDEGIVHGDLKGANILVTKSGRACLADFGLSTLSHPSILGWSSRYTSTGKAFGTPLWRAPELFNMEDSVDLEMTTMSDVYSLGVSVTRCVPYCPPAQATTMTLPKITTGRRPFYQCTNTHNAVYLASTGERPTKPDPEDPAWKFFGLNEDVWTFIEWCWRQEPKERPTSLEIQQHTLFTGLCDLRVEQKWGGETQFGTGSASEFRRRVMSSARSIGGSALLGKGGCEVGVHPQRFRQIPPPPRSRTVRAWEDDNGESQTFHPQALRPSMISGSVPRDEHLYFASRHVPEL